MTALRISSLSLAAIGCFAIAIVLPLGLLDRGVPGPGLFPFFAAVVLVFASIGSALTHDPQDSDAQPADRWRLFLYAAAIVAFVVVINLFGMVFATFCFVVGVLRWIECKSWPRALSAGGGLALLSWSVFDLLLGVPLPTGSLEFG
jgi:putative tricarboxylic transport membrane protein